MNPILDALQGYFQTAFGSAFTTYFKGKVIVVAQDEYPILMVYPVSTLQAHSGTVRDKVEYKIAVEARISLKTYLDNTNGDGVKLDTLDRLVEIVEKRGSDGELDPTSIMGIINANLQIGHRAVYTDNMEALYEQYMDSRQFPAAKVIVTFTAYDRPDR